jgi:hypothetical protein
MESCNNICRHQIRVNEHYIKIRAHTKLQYLGKETRSMSTDLHTPMSKGFQKVVGKEQITQKADILLIDRRALASRALIENKTTYIHRLGSKRSASNHREL